MIMVEFSIDRKDRKIDGQRERERERERERGRSSILTERHT